MIRVHTQGIIERGGVQRVIWAAIRRVRAVYGGNVVPVETLLPLLAAFSDRLHIRILHVLDLRFDVVHLASYFAVLVLVRSETVGVLVFLERRRVSLLLQSSERRVELLMLCFA